MQLLSPLAFHLAVPIRERIRDNHKRVVRKEAVFMGITIAARASIIKMFFLIFSILYILGYGWYVQFIIH